jgi:hypothetical protein
MSIIPCNKNEELRRQIETYAEELKVEAHKLGTHGLGENEFYNSGLFRGAIELIRGQFSATMRDKRIFVRRVLNFMEDHKFIASWEEAGHANRHDYSVTLNSGRVAAIEAKGCLDGNNTTIFERPAQAQEFIIWSVCTNESADPQHNAWSGIHTRLSAEIISRSQLIDGIIVWDMVCGTIHRPCPKIESDKTRFTEVGPYLLPPPCIYVFPATIPHPRNNQNPVAQSLQSVEILQAFHTCFQGHDEEVNYVDFEVRYRDTDKIIRKTRIRRAGVVQKESKSTPIRRA